MPTKSLNLNSEGYTTPLNSQVRKYARIYQSESPQTPQLQASVPHRQCYAFYESQSIINGCSLFCQRYMSILSVLWLFSLEWTPMKTLIPKVSRSQMILLIGILSPHRKSCWQYFDQCIDFWRQELVFCLSFYRFEFLHFWLIQSAYLNSQIFNPKVGLSSSFWLRYL